MDTGRPNTTGAKRPSAGVNAGERKSQQVLGGLESGAGLENRVAAGVGRESEKGPPNILFRDSKESEETATQEKQLGR